MSYEAKDHIAQAFGGRALIQEKKKRECWAVLHLRVEPIGMVVHRHEQ